MSLASLKKNSMSTLEKLKAAAQEASSKSSGSADTRFWAPKFDKERGTGSAVIRFMPAPEGEDLPWVKVFKHAFKGPTGKWYIENSLSTIGGKSDCVGNMNSRLWNSGIESDKDVARGMKRKTEYFSNVLVIKDPANPENEGKVFLYKFGPMIFEMVNAKMFPDEIDGDAAINPFDAWTGADFVIKITGKKIGLDLVPNYEKSYFKDPSPIDSDDDVIESHWQKCHSLAAFVDPKNFKTEEELKKKLFEVLGPTVGSGISVLEGVADPAPTQSRAAQKPAARAPAAEPKVESSSDVPSTDDDDLAELRALFED